MRLIIRRSPCSLFRGCFLVPSFFFFNDTATTEIYTLSPTRRSSDLRTSLGEFLAKTSKENCGILRALQPLRDRKSTRLNSSHDQSSYAVFCLKKRTWTATARWGRGSSRPTSWVTRYNCAVLRGGTGS